MTSKVVDKNISEPLMQYVPIADYQRPAAPITHNAREHLASFRRLFQRRKEEQEAPLKVKENLAAVPPYLLDRIAPTPDWGAFADALRVNLSAWLTDDNPLEPVVLIVGPPNSGNKETLEVLVEQLGWRLLRPPTPEQILEADESWVAGQGEEEKRPWVLPALEDIYLRHVEGITLVRQFLDDALSGKLGKGIIGCDSWAWAYISRIWRGRIPTTLTLQSFDEKKLTTHLRMVAHVSGTRQLLFRQSDNGKYVLPLEDVDAVPGETSSFLQILGAHSRGIIGLALEILRGSLLTEPSENLPEEDQIKEPGLPHQTVWVIPWNQIEFPSLPGDAGIDEAFVLHTLLVHNGLSLELLTLLLPLSSHQTRETLYRLEERGVVVVVQNVWRVSALGYMAVRHFLHNNSYLVDQF